MGSADRPTRWCSPTGTRRPASAALIGTGVAAALVYLVLRFSQGAGGVALFWFLWTAGVLVVLPVWAVRARPATLGLAFSAWRCRPSRCV